MLSLDSHALTCQGMMGRSGSCVHCNGKIPEVDTDLLPDWASSRWGEGHLHSSPAVALDRALP